MNTSAMAKEFACDWGLKIETEKDLTERLDMLAREARNSGLESIKRRVLNELQYTTDGKVSIEWLVSVIELWKM